MLKRTIHIIFLIAMHLTYFAGLADAPAAKAGPKTTIYLFPGQGSDERIFAAFRPDTAIYTLVPIKYPVPAKGTSLPDFARQIGVQIDTTRPYIFIGVSLGGMICTELTDSYHPQKTIIISSAKCRSELPGRYKFQKTIPLYRIVPKGLVKAGARMLQPIVEPDRKKNKAVFKSMLKSKDKRYLKRTVGMIIRWDRKIYSDKIIHIHGTSDHTLPYSKIRCNYTIEEGSHMMTLTRGQEINELLCKILQAKD